MDTLIEKDFTDPSRIFIQYQDKTVLFAFAAANPDGIDHVRMVNGRMGFEDLLGTSSDGDFNDLVIGFDIA